VSMVQHWYDMTPVVITKVMKMALTAAMGGPSQTSSSTCDD